MGLGEGFFRGGVGLCWGVGRGVEGGEGNKRGRISGEEERFWGGRREFGKGRGKVSARVVFYDRIVDS